MLVCASLRPLRNEETIMNQIDVMKQAVMLLRDGPDNNVQAAVDLLCQAIEQAHSVHLIKVIGIGKGYRPDEHDRGEWRDEDGICVEFPSGHRFLYYVSEVLSDSAVEQAGKVAELPLENAQDSEGIMSEMDFEFEHEGRVVRPGQGMYVNPGYLSQAGLRAKVERYYGDSVMLRADNGAVPTVPVSALSWAEFPTTRAVGELVLAGFPHPTNREVEIWVAAQKAAKEGKA
jgi:hypothetical protein